ncbi:hypothetical protein GF373_02590, partial [bacterium]|nr:hypothetical protein [bacterium]
MHTRRIITGLGFIPIFLVGILWEYGDWFTAAVVSLCFFAIREEMYSLMGIKRDNTLMLWQNVLAVLFFIFTVTHN